MATDNGRVGTERRTLASPGAAVHLALSRQLLRVAFEAVARGAGIEVRAELASGSLAATAATEPLWVVTDALDRRGARTIMVVSHVSPPVAQRLVDDFQVRRLAAVLLEDDPWLLVSAVHLAARGHGVLADDVRRRASEGPRLSERDLAVLGRLARGRSNTQIAREMHVSPTTVKRVVTRLLRAFGCPTRLELTAVAWEKGYVVAR